MSLGRSLGNILAFQLDFTETRHYIGAMKTQGTPIKAAKQIREDAGAFWFRVRLTDGRVVIMSVPKE